MNAPHSVITKQDEKMISDILGQNKKKRSFVRTAPKHNKLGWPVITIRVSKELAEAMDEDIKGKPWMNRSGWTLEAITERVKILKSKQNHS